MNQNLRLRRHRGFTLVELAIVLAVTGVLFLGLYRLLSGGNQQVKDSATASQQVQLINAVKQYLSSSAGSAYMAEFTATTSKAIALPLPTVAPDGITNGGCKGNGPFASDTNLKSFCDALPAGFEGAAGANPTLNAYGQYYQVQILLPAVTTAGTAPATYTFMTATVGGDIISDADGGRISSEIGADGGFVYANTAVCASGYACGSYGAWTQLLSTFGLSTAAGHIASRTYYSPEIGSTVPWLARLSMSNDPAVAGGTSPEHNTMSTDLYLGNNNLWLSNNNTASAAASVQAINLQGGKINLQTGGILDNANLGDALDLQVPSGSYLKAPPTGTSNAFLNLTSRCTADSTISPPGVAYESDCQVALFIAGDQNVFGRVQAYDLFSGTFVYQASDMRLKTNIEPLPHSLDSIMQLKPVSFNFKQSGQKGLGFIAQDIEKVYPQLVVERGDKMKAVNYEGLIAPLVESVQELKRENEDLRQKLHDQEERQNRLERSSRSSQ